MAIVDETQSNRCAHLAVRKLYDWSLKGNTYRFSKCENARISKTETGTTNCIFFFPFFVHDPSWFRALVRDEFSEGKFSRRQKISSNYVLARKNHFSMMLSDSCSQVFSSFEGNNASFDRRCVDGERNTGSRRLLRRIEHEDECARKSGAYSLHRGEKSEVGPFSEKWVEKVSNCIHIRTRRGVGHPPWRPCLKRRTWLGRFHIYVTVFRHASRLINHNRVFSLSSIGRVSKCVVALLQLIEASIR